MGTGDHFVACLASRVRASGNILPPAESASGNILPSADIRTVRCSIPGRSNIFLASPKRPDRLWGPPSLQFSGYRGSYPGQQQQGHEADLVPRLRTSGAASFHGVVRNNLILCIYIPLYDGGGVCKPSPPPPSSATILSEVAPKSYNRYQNTAF